MSAIGGPNIVEDNLVLSYDAANIKSFRGEPTVNLIPNADIMTDWITYYRTQSLSTFTTEFGTIGYRFIRQPSWNGIYKFLNLVNTGTYTFSARFKYLGGSVNNNGATVYVTNYGGGDTAVGLDKSKIGIWQKVSHTVNVTSPSNVGFLLISYGGVDNGTGDPDFSSWEVTQPQIEFKPYSTPFVNGSRGTTVATGGGWADRSGNNNHGELVNGATFDSDNLGSLVFDGVDDYVFTTGVNTSEYMSMSCWFKTSVQQNNKYLVAMGLNLTGNNGFDLTFQNTQIGSYIVVSGSNSGGVLYTTNYYDNNWHHIITTYDGSVGRFYYDGVEVATRTGMSGGIIIESTKRLNIGSWVNNLGNANASISQVKIYNRALTPQEVLQNYNATKGRYGL